MHRRARPATERHTALHGGAHDAGDRQGGLGEGILAARSVPGPIIVGGFGPRMAAIAGRHSDGFNTQALHPRLAELIDVAREARAAAGREALSFVVTVFAGMSKVWLRPDARARQLAERAGVDRLILLLEPPFDPGEIRAAGRLLTAGAR